jgi:titin
LKSFAGGEAVISGKVALIQKDSSPNESTASSSRVTLTWDYHSSNELGFKIERKERAGGVYHEIATTGKNVTKYTDSGLSPGLIYFYRVRAYNSHGRSAPSNEIRVKTSAH